MQSDYAPRMTNESYFNYLERGASSNQPEEVRALRREVIALWHGDARADDLAEALYAHEIRLAERDGSPRARPTFDSRVFKRKHGRTQ
ncbi:MAG: hypothetical protein M3081_01020 [Gemmatimonadota bacterium]|nr:hypothetical protein [Gemmatimonadota bacterium]